jgi:hypothetical protein
LRAPSCFLIRRRTARVYCRKFARALGINRENPQRLFRALIFPNLPSPDDGRMRHLTFGYQPLDPLAKGLSCTSPARGHGAVWRMATSPERYGHKIAFVEERDFETAGART